MTEKRTHSIKVTSKAANVDQEVMDEYPYFIADFNHGQYTANQEFTISETSLFWKVLTRTYLFQNEKKMQGHEPMKGPSDSIVGYANFLSPC